MDRQRLALPLRSLVPAALTVERISQIEPMRGACGIENERLPGSFFGGDRLPLLAERDAQVIPRSGIARVVGNRLPQRCLRIPRAAALQVNHTQAKPGQWLL